MTTTTIIFGVEGGIPSLPAELAPLFVNTSGDYWVAEFPASLLAANGITATPGGDALTAQYIIDVRFQGRDYAYFVGSGTAPCYQLLSALLDADFVDDGPSATANPSIDNRLAVAVDGGGNRKLKRLLRTSDSAPVSWVPANVVAGQDPIEAALSGTGLTVNDVQLEVV